MPPPSPNTSLAIAPMPPSEPISDDASSGIRTILLLLAEADLRQRLGVFLGDEVVERLHVALGDRLGDDLRRPRLGLGRAFARLGVAEGGFLAAFGFEHLGLLQAFRLRLCLLQAFRLEDLRALVALGHHLAGHRVRPGWPAG